MGLGAWARTQRSRQGRGGVPGGPSTRVGDVPPSSAHVERSRAHRGTVTGLDLGV